MDKHTKDVFIHKENNRTRLYKEKERKKKSSDLIKSNFVFFVKIRSNFVVEPVVGQMVVVEWMVLDELELVDLMYHFGTEV